ncbi:MAG TPA: GWxTD domain-containing protein [Gemmatimonadales bacterium]|nr:GWxTD domain-containing protein [Gemmatimonadales bacterium]
MSGLSRFALAGIILAGQPAATPAVQVEPELELRAVRFYRAESGTTRVKAFAEIPFSLMEPTGGGPDGHLSYQVTFRVVDSTGLTLHQQSWRARASVAARQAGAEAVELLDFALAPGRYRIEVGVQDSVSGRRIDGTLPIEAFRERPPASDLLLSPRMRLADGTAAAEPGEFPQGNTLVTAVAELALTPLRSRAYYLVEAYSEGPDSGALAVRVQDSTGQPVVRTRPVAVTLPPGGGVLRGQVDLAGLPPGEYTLCAELTIGGRTVERRAPLVMARLDSTLARAAEQTSLERRTDAGYFGAMDDAELKEARAPLVYLEESADRLKHFEEVSLAAKRKLLVDFWQRRDPTPGTPENEAREAFYRAIDYANRTFREGGRNPRAGWRSDRGRIYARNGTPDDVLQRQREGQAPPYLVWRYTRDRNRYYIFVDRTGFGAYELVASNDLREPSRPDWIRFIGAPAAQDIERYLGVTLLNAD